MLRARVARLPEPARRLLEAVAVAGHPTELQVAEHAAGIPGEGQAALGVLRAERLLPEGHCPSMPLRRTTIVSARTLVCELPAEALRAIHRKLALALTASGKADSERLAAHFHGAGEIDSAAEYAAMAAAELRKHSPAPAGAPTPDQAYLAAAATRGRVDDAVRGVESAEAGFRAAAMVLHAAVAQRRRGELVGGDEGAALTHAADSWMRRTEHPQSGPHDGDARAWRMGRALAELGREEPRTSDRGVESSFSSLDD